MNDDPAYQHIRIERDTPVATIVLARPEALNAFNARLIEEFTDAISRLNVDPDVRVIVIRGEGRAFSAGADVNWMRDSKDYSRPQNVEDARRLAEMMERLVRTGKPTVCCAHGYAIGGGLGIIGCCDYAILATGTKLAFSEVKLGIVPATITPYVLRKMKPGDVAALYVTGERFDAERALRIGLAQSVVKPEQLHAEVKRVVAELLTSAPDAIAIAKHMIYDVSGMSPLDALEFTIETIATKRTDPEGQEGLSAFIDGRSPRWVPEGHNATWVKNTAGKA